MKTLDPKIVSFLSNKLKVSKKTITNSIYDLSKHYPKSTHNTRAYLYAKDKGINIYKLLDKEDRSTIPSAPIYAPTAPQTSQKGFKVIVQGDKETHWIRNLIIGSLIIGTIVGIISQIAGTVIGVIITNHFGLTKP